jgi:hypothetical protein
MKIKKRRVGMTNTLALSCTPRRLMAVRNNSPPSVMRSSWDCRSGKAEASAWAPAESDTATVST